MVVHTRNFSTWEEESGRSGHLRLHSKFKVSLGYVRRCLKQTTSKDTNHWKTLDCLPHLELRLLYCPHTFSLLCSPYGALPDASIFPKGFEERGKGEKSFGAPELSTKDPA